MLMKIGHNLFGFWIGFGGQLGAASSFQNKRGEMAEEEPEFSEVFDMHF
ncbi:hypothetical protein A2U01_0080060, partial [Trifolium medium]|nr:hypothetical protein [Trifolium medium]